MSDTPQSSCGFVATLVFAATLLPGCGGRTGLEGAGPQSSALDAGPMFDAGSPVDASPMFDAGSPVDAGPTADAESPPDAADASISCSPGVLADGLLLPWSLVLDTTDVYWLESSPGGGPADEIQRCAKTGCPARAAATLVSGVSTGLAVDATSVFWATRNPDVVDVCDKAACAATPFVSLGASAVYLAVDDQSLFIASYDSISRCSKTGCAAPTLLASLSAPPIGIALDQSDVYFIEGAPGALRACAKPDCAGGPRIIADHVTAYALQVDDASVYFCTGGGASDPDTAGAILSCPKSGCAGAPKVLAAGLHHPASLALNASRVYWADQGTSAKLYADGDVESCPKAGCGAGPKVHASQQSLPASVAVDDGCVYWATDTYGTANPGGAVQSALK